ncbi:MAG: hypothetical protein V3R85_04030 [Alphaproteobacteria bacterium]
MTAFRNSALALIILVAGVGGSQAQVPVRPTPAQPTDMAIPTSDPSAPVRLGPRRTIGPDVRSAPVPAVQPGPSAGPTTGPVVSVQTLESVDADSVGTLDDAEGGLGIDMWNGTGRALVGRLIALLPRRMSSPAMRDLMRRLLLTRAEAPVSENREPGLFTRRVSALVAVGDRASTRALIELAPSGKVDEQLLWTRVESWFYGYDTGNACRIVQGEAQEQKSTYWLQATAFCLALGGKTAEASLVSDILDERGEKVPPVFFTAMEAIAGATPPPLENMETLTGLHLAMLRAARLPVPNDALENASPAALAAVAAHPQTPADQRLATAEEAALLGPLKGRALFEIYGDTGIAVDDLETALTRAAAEWGPRSRALLVRAAARYDVPAARAEVLQQAFKLARQKGGFRVVALAARPLLQGMEPADELRWFAPHAARALLATNQRTAAAGWIALAMDENRASAESTDLWPLAALTRGAGDEAVTPEAVTEWWSKQDHAADGARARARVLFTLLEAEAVALSGALWADILDQTRRDDMAGPSVALRHALARAATEKRRGETVALVLLTLGDTGPVPGNLLAVELAVRALRQVGLGDDARRMVLETAIAAGL